MNIATTNNITTMAYGLGNFKTITQSDLIDIITNYDAANLGAQPISFTTVTTPVYRKTNFPFPNLFKVGQTSGIIGFDYESNVNAQREREGKTPDFVKQENSKVKQWLSRSVGITNKDLTVIRYRPVNTSQSFFVAGGKRVNLTEIQPFLYSYDSNSQGVDKAIQYRLYGIDKIVAVSFMKNEYVISNLDKERVDAFMLVVDDLKT